MRIVGPSLELIDLVNGLHEGLFLFTEFCFSSQQGCITGQFYPSTDFYVLRKFITYRYYRKKITGNEND